jgi:hypothetical protein
MLKITIIFTVENWRRGIFLFSACATQLIPPLLNAPTVIGTNPDDEATDVPLGQVIGIQFSDDMNQASTGKRKYVTIGSPVFQTIV